MKIYDKITEIAGKYKGFSNNDNITGNLAADLVIISTLLMLCVLTRHVSILVCIILLVVLSFIFISKLPIIPIFRKEQDDSLDKMLFYSILTIGILFTVIYWGGNLV